MYNDVTYDLDYEELFRKLLLPPIPIILNHVFRVTLFACVLKRLDLRALELIHQVLSYSTTFPKHRGGYAAYETKRDTFPSSHYDYDRTIGGARL